MHGVFWMMISAFRACLARLVTERSAVPAVEKILRGGLLVPIFGAMLVLLRLRAWIYRPLAGEATTRFGSRFHCHLPDFIQTYLYLFGIWEPDITSFIQRRLSPGDTFIDVGANIGYHVLLAAKHLDGAGRVVAIEASPLIFRSLRANLNLNGASANVRSVNMAASDVQGILNVYRGPVHNVGLTTTIRSRGFAPETEIPAAPLADMLEPPEIKTSRLVKIDVEGGEDLVLLGMKGFLQQCPRDVEILVELSPQWWADRQRTPQQVLQIFFDAGFHAYEIKNNLWPWRYLWPNDVTRPRRIRHPMTKRVKRIDLVLSREDAAML